MIIVLEQYASRRALRGLKLCRNVLAALALGWVLGVVSFGYYVILWGVK